MSTQNNPMVAMKPCSICKEPLPLSSFYKNRRSSDGHQSTCKECAKSGVIEWQRRNPEKAGSKAKRWKDANRPDVRASHAIYKRERRESMTQEERSAMFRKEHLSSKYGISIDHYESMLSAQGGVCAICESGPGKLRLAVDHNHETGENRGLLCSKCNKSLERMENVEDWHTKAINYLAKYLTVRMDMKNER